MESAGAVGESAEDDAAGGAAEQGGGEGGECGEGASGGAAGEGDVGVGVDAADGEARVFDHAFQGGGGEEVHMHGGDEVGVSGTEQAVDAAEVGEKDHEQSAGGSGFGRRGEQGFGAAEPVMRVQSVFEDL